MKDKSHKRHIAKAVTWRIVGTLDTILLAWLISGNPFTGLKIGFAEVVTKMVLYYFHERLWFSREFEDRDGLWNSRRRHIVKAVSWRIVGTIDTMLLAWIISGSPTIGLQIGLAEVITKMILYYLHERTWYRIDFGVAEKRRERKSKIGFVKSDKHV